MSRSFKIGSMGTRIALYLLNHSVIKNLNDEIRKKVLCAVIESLVNEGWDDFDKCECIDPIFDELIEKNTVDKLY